MLQKLKSLSFKQVKILSKIIDMREYNFDSFWEDVIKARDIRYPKPKFITGYEARKQHGFTDYVVRSLVRDGLVRTDGQETPKYALEDLLLMKKVRDNWAKVEEAEIVKETVIQGNKKYLVMDLYKKNKSLNKHQTEIITMIHQDFYDDIYHFVPKNLPKEEKKKYLENLINELDNGNKK